jgi:hypothetical protein
MRGEWQIIDLGKVGDLLAFCEPTAFGHVRHNDVRRLLLQQLAETLAQIEILPYADRRAAPASHLTQGVDVLSGDRLLQPHQIERLHLPSDAGGARHVITRVKVDAEVDVRPSIRANVRLDGPPYAP